MAVAGAVLLILLAILAAAVPVLSPYSYQEQNPGLQNAGTSAAHIFGTDKFGRDVFVRVWYGTQISLLVGIISTGINTGIGVLYGGIAGYAGNRTDMILMRAADIIAAIPSLIYVILITLVTGGNMIGITLGICISGWIDMARTVRTEVLRQKERDYCMAARLSGARMEYVLFRHLIPNAAGPILVHMVFLISGAIFTETFLSFIGVGIGAPAASLGTLISDARSQMQLYPMQMVYPMVVLCLLICALNFIGNGLEQTAKQNEE